MEPTYFAEVIDGIVQRVIVARQEFINSGLVGDPKNWVETKIDSQIEKFAGIGDEHHPELSDFVSPKPFDSWTLDTELKQYISPVEKPILEVNETANWNEKQQTWDKVVLSEQIIIE